MNMLEMITANEKQEFMNLVNTYAEKRCAVSFEDLMAVWDVTKRPLFDSMFHNCLRIEREVEFTKPLNEIANEMTHDKILFTHPFWEVFAPFIRNNREMRDLYWCLMGPYNLAKNLIEGLYPSVVLENNGKKIVIKNGMKVSRAIKKISDLFDIRGVDEWLQLHSTYLNTKKVKGTFVLSIHPLDFITMSHGTQWSSCMSWESDGCYRRGTIEMMNSPNVVVGYLKGDRGRKKWRTLYIVEDDIACNIKGYPYFCKELEMFGLNLIQELLNNRYDNITYQSFEDFEDKHAGTVTHYIDFCTNAMYNDFEGHRNDMHALAYNKSVLEHLKENDLTIEYSGPEICMSCGTQTHDFDNEERLVCCSCENSLIHCCSCGELIQIDGDNAPIDDGLYIDENGKDFYVIDGDYYCEYCKENAIDDGRLISTVDDGRLHHYGAVYPVKILDDTGYTVDKCYFYYLPWWTENKFHPENYLRITFEEAEQLLNDSKGIKNLSRAEAFKEFLKSNLDYYKGE